MLALTVLVLSAAAVAAMNPCTTRVDIPFDTQGNYVRTTSSGRRYLIHAPPGFDWRVQRPVVMSFHGHSATSFSHQHFSNYSHPGHRIDGKQYFSVYPQGVEGKEIPCRPEMRPSFSWQGAPFAADGVDDIDFTSQVLDELDKLLCIDKRRIYVSGESNGGTFANLLACTPSINKRIAAIGTASAAIFPDTTPFCKPGRAIPVVSTHGMNDELVPYDGLALECPGARNEVLSAFTWQMGWARNNGCSWRQTRMPSVFRPSKGLSLHIRECANNADVYSYSLDQFGHNWPTEQNTLNGFDATTDAFLPFFDAHPLM